MILAHVLVAIDYYAKCPNLKKPDSLSSTYIVVRFVPLVIDLNPGYKS